VKIRLARLEKAEVPSGDWSKVTIFMFEAEDGTRTPIDAQAREYLTNWEEARAAGYTGPEPFFIILPEDKREDFI
jgi:hypothetical protein